MEMLKTLVNMLKSRKLKSTKKNVKILALEKCAFLEFSLLDTSKFDRESTLVKSCLSISGNDHEQQDSSAI